MGEGQPRKQKENIFFNVCVGQVGVGVGVNKVGVGVKPPREMSGVMTSTGTK